MHIQSLELKIPPPLVATLIAIAMWGLSIIAPTLELPTQYRVAAAIAIALVGGAFSIAGVLSFRRARTSVSPMKPELASTLVSSGIYRITRNPMYVGMSFVLVAWAVFLAAPWLLLGPLVFCFYIGSFQIAPEEKALSKIFGAEYAAYKAKVRRWL